MISLRLDRGSVVAERPKMLQFFLRLLVKTFQVGWYVVMPTIISFLGSVDFSFVSKNEERSLAHADLKALQRSVTGYPLHFMCNAFY